MVFFGVLLIFLGTFWLLTNLGLLSADFWTVFWPVFLILLGIKAVMIPLKWRRFWHEKLPWNWDKKKIRVE